MRCLYILLDRVGIIQWTIFGVVSICVIAATCCDCANIPESALLDGGLAQESLASCLCLWIWEKLIWRSDFEKRFRKHVGKNRIGKPIVKNDFGDKRC